MTPLTLGIASGLYSALGTEEPKVVFLTATRVQDMAMPLDEYRASGKSEFDTTPKALFNEAIEALLADDTIHQRVSQARGCLEKLERVNGEADEKLIKELRCIIDDVEAKIKRSQDVLSSEDERELSERLFSLYLDMSDGVLIW